MVSDQWIVNQIQYSPKYNFMTMFSHFSNVMSVDSLTPLGARPSSGTVMMTSSNGNILRVISPCAGNSSVTGEFPAQSPVTRSLDVSFDLHLNKRLNKQSRGWLFETPSRSLWRHCNGDDQISCPVYVLSLQAYRGDQWFIFTNILWAQLIIHIL